MKMEVTIDVVDGVIPLYDKDGGKWSFVAGNRGVRRMAKKNTSVLLPMFPVTPTLLRSMADTLEAAQKDDRQLATLAVQQEDSTAGLLCV